MPSSGRLVLNPPGGAVMRVVGLGAQKILGEAYTTLVAAEGAYHHFNTGSRGSDVVNDITQRQQVLMSSG